MKRDQSSLNVRSTKSHSSKKINKRRLQKDSNVPLSAMKYVTQNYCNYFDIGIRVTLFGLNNMEFNGKVCFIGSPT